MIAQTQRILRVVHQRRRRHFQSILRQASLNHRRSSATLMARNDAPIISTLYFSRCRSRELDGQIQRRLPPTVGNSACGRSREIISSRYSLGQRLDVRAWRARDQS